MKILTTIGVILFSLSFFSSSKGMTDVNGSEFLLQNLRLFNDINPIQDDWIEIDTTLAEMDPTDLNFNWEKMNTRANKWLGKTIKMYTHFAEDLKEVGNKIDENQVQKLKPFLDTAFIYADITLQVIKKRATIINRLYKMSLDPESWTAEEYLEEMNTYQELSKKYEELGLKMNDEFKKTETIIINLN